MKCWKGSATSIRLLGPRRRGSSISQWYNKKSVTMAGTLFVVATPIGNLEDLTFRAARILREVPLVAAEDTRRSGHLLRHLGAVPRRCSACTSTTRTPGHGRGPAAVGQGRVGGRWCPTPGTPAISDPGARLVAAVVAAGYRVEPVPGPSAVMAALVGGRSRRHVVHVRWVSTC